MATPEQIQSFLTDILPAVQNVAERIALYPATIAAQWATETGYGLAMPQNNYAGISAGNRVLSFATLSDFLNDYVATMSLSYYADVRAASDITEQMQALGQSPWSAAHYAAPGQPAGSILEAVWTDDLAPIWTACCAAAHIELSPGPQRPNATSEITTEANTMTTDAIGWAEVMPSLDHLVERLKEALFDAEAIQGVASKEGAKS